MEGLEKYYEFRPSDQRLINAYLRLKIIGKDVGGGSIHDADVTSDPLYNLMRKNERLAVSLAVETRESKDGNGAGSDRVECLGTQNRNPNLKPESTPKIVSGENPSPKPKPADPRNPTD